MSLNTFTIHELQKKLILGEVSSLQITESVLDQISAVDDKVNAYINIDREKVISFAKKADELRKQGSDKPLLGIPITIKDNINIKGVETTCSSRILKGYVSPYNAMVIEKLIDLGAVLIPRANMDEFAMGSSTETAYDGVTKNPWDLERVPGGSSGGSCASVAADEAVAALGSDTGGSIRQPAALCGVVGMKPTYGRVSRYGLIAFASSLDQIGPITKDVRDSAILLEAISGYDKKDSTSINKSVPDYTKNLEKDVKGMKIGIPKEYFAGGIDPEVKKAIESCIETFSANGAEIIDISLPHTEYAVPVYYIIATAEASSNLARYDGVQYGYRANEDKMSLIDMYSKTRAEGFGQEVKRRIILGAYVLSSGYYDAYYLKAQKVRTLISNDFREAFKKVDIILTPTSPTPAFKIGERLKDPLSMYLSDIYTISVNLAGLPAISVPCGLTSENLPIGLQLIGKPFDEEKILNTAYVYEQNSDRKRLWNMNQS